MRPRTILTICAATVVILALVASPAVAQKKTHRGMLTNHNAVASSQPVMTDVRCEPVHAHFLAPTFFDTCVYQGHFYEWCLENPVRGSLSGTWRYYGSPETWWESEVTPGALGESWGFAGTSALAVIETRRGILYGQDTLVWHAEAGDEGVGYVRLVGGTGRYEGATGWLGYIAETLESATILGRICTPIDP